MRSGHYLLFGRRLPFADGDPPPCAEHGLRGGGRSRCRRRAVLLSLPCRVGHGSGTGHLTVWRGTACRFDAGARGKRQLGGRTGEESGGMRKMELLRKFARRASAKDIVGIGSKLGAMNRGPVQPIWDKVQQLWRFIADPEVAWSTKALAAGSLLSVPGVAP